MRVIVNGAHGKMGRLAVKTISDDGAFELVAGLGREDNLADAIKNHQADIVVDLTRADSVYHNTLTIIEQGAHPVIGTSGLLPNQLTQLQSMSNERNLGGIIVPNFSIAAVLMMRFAAQAAAYLPAVEIIESHHPQKAEAPSGTAIKTAELIAKSRIEPIEPPLSKPILDGALGATYDGVPIHSLRLLGTLAEQTVRFGQTGETLSIQHQTIDRISFMPGVLLACQKVSELSSLVYGLEHLLS